MIGRELASYTCGAMTARYVEDSDGCVGLALVPTERLDDQLVHRPSLEGDVSVAYMPDGDQLPAARVEPLAHVKLIGDAYAGGFAQGTTMRRAATVEALRYYDQAVNKGADGSQHIATRLRHADGWQLVHHLLHVAGAPYLRVWCELVNSSDAAIDIEVLTSFALGGITPFSVDHGAECLYLHRFRSHWSSEGRHERILLEDLHLERTWTGYSAIVERFGQVGSMPVRNFFPFVAIEDSSRGVFWGAQLACSGSWQLEVSRNDDFASLSGGQADREFGHWVKHLKPGESLVTPEAVLSTLCGDLDDLCHALVQAQQPRPGQLAPAEEELPIIFNEWCTSWGTPSHENVLKLVDVVKELGAHYLVLDAGWYKPDEGNWGSAAGDWEPSESLYPDGLDATVAAIRDAGLVPGLWFEFEVVGGKARASNAHADHQLTRDGYPLTSGERRFWDMRDPWCHQYLKERVIERLRRHGFGYLKIDYNETIGIGVDGAESLGEGLRQHIEGVHTFFETIREELPELTIETCSSGGHRLEPAMLARSDMGSFSDSHEGLDIPIIAAGLHRLMLPRQLQVWAVLHGTDGNSRLIYSLAAAFLGRMCLSGDVWTLSAKQRQLVKEAVALYRQVVPILRDGTSRLYGPTISSWRTPRHWQAVVRTAADGNTAFAVLHTFSLDEPQYLRIPLPRGRWQIVDQLSTNSGELEAGPRALHWRQPRPFRGAVVLLRRRED